MRLLGSLLIGIDVLLFGTGAGTAMALTLTSPAFKQGGKIPSSYTCEGDDVSPPLVFEGVPEGTKSLALVIDDPDAPDPKAPKRVWVHWVVFNLPPDTKELAENASATGLPAGAVARRERLGSTRLMAVLARRSDGIAISTSSMRST